MAFVRIYAVENTTTKFNWCVLERRIRCVGASGWSGKKNCVGSVDPGNILGNFYSIQNKRSRDYRLRICCLHSVIPLVQWFR